MLQAQLSVSYKVISETTAPTNMFLKERRWHYRTVPWYHAAVRVPVSKVDYQAGVAQFQKSDAPGGADRSNHPGIQGAGSGIWSGDHSGLKSSFKQSLRGVRLGCWKWHIGGRRSSGRRSSSQNAFGWWRVRLEPF